MLAYNASWRRLADFFSLTLAIVCPMTYSIRLTNMSIKRLQDSLEDKELLLWRDLFKTCLQDVFKIFVEVVFQTSCRQIICLLGRNLCLFYNKYQVVSDKSLSKKPISDKCKANLTNLYLRNLYLTSLRKIQDKSKMH